jgi:hypothetical protein
MNKTNSNNISEFFTFTPPAKQVEAPKRLAISADGLDKRGKTHWALMTTPDPVLVITCDPGTKNIVDKARAAGRTIGSMPIQFEIPDMSKIRAADINTTQHAQWRKEWDHIESAVYALIAEPATATRTRTLVFDTGTDIKNLLELAYFGKARGNARADIRTEMNGALHKLWWDLYNGRPDLNIIVIHRSKKMYLQNSKGDAVWNGKYERDGHAKIGFYVDLTLTFDWDPHMKDFYTEIDANQPFRYMDFENQLIGRRWYSQDKNDPSAFWNLAMEVFPQTQETPEIWGI